MALNLNLDRDNRGYFTLICDACFARFVCYDDACYTFASLRLEAVTAGWDAGPRPEEPDHCPSCVRNRTTTDPRRIISSPHGRSSLRDSR